MFADVGRFAASILGEADSGGNGAMAVCGDGFQVTEEREEECVIWCMTFLFGAVRDVDKGGGVSKRGG